MTEKTGIDLITRFFELLAEAAPSLSESLAEEIERQIRHEFAGERVYIHKRNDALATRIAEKFNGRNVRDLSNDLRVSRRTVYRVIKKSRRDKK